MSADKYPSIFSRQMATIVYIANDNIANQIHGFTIDYGKCILINDILPRQPQLQGSSSPIPRI